MKFPDFYPGIIWLMASMVLMSLPGSTIPSGFAIPNLDKWVHVGLFASFNFLWMLPFLLYRPGNHVALVAISFAVTLYGLLMEFFQLCVIPNRSFEMADVLADAGGAMLALVFVYTRWGRNLVKKIGPDRNRGRNQN